MDAYDIIYLGYSTWRGAFPLAVFTSLESYIFQEKQLFRFANEGSGIGGSETDIKKLCPDAKVLAGLAIRDGRVKSAYNSLIFCILKQ